MGEKQTAAKKALNCLYLECHDSIVSSVQQKVLDAFDEIKEETVKEVVEQLLKQMFLCTFENGYPVDAVPKSTVLSLPGLMKIHWNQPVKSLDEERYHFTFQMIMGLFPEEFREYYISNSLAHNTVQSLMQGGNIYNIFFELLKMYNTLEKKYVEAASGQPIQYIIDDKHIIRELTTHNDENVEGRV